MADIMRVKRSTMTSLGDITRSLTGTTGNLTTAQMQSGLTTVKTNVDETKELIREMTGDTGDLSIAEMKAKAEVVRQNIQNALDTIATKGVTVPDGANSDNLVELIGAIEAGAKTVEGTFSIASMITGANTPVITISGLGFKPRMVFVFKSNGSSYGANASQVLVQGFFRIEDTCWVHSVLRATSSSSASVGVSFTETYAILTTSEDGFDIATGSGTTYQNRVPPGTYTYVAVS